jgi:hypothetical protein
MPQPKPILRLLLLTSVVALAFLAGPRRLSVQAGSALSYRAHLPEGIDPQEPIYLPIVLQQWPPAPVDLSIGRIEVIQGITMGDSYTVQIADRPALLRAFINLAGTAEQAGVAARLTRYVGGAAQDSLAAGPVTIQATTDEGNLGHTLNFNLPGSWLAPGTDYVLEVDPDNAIYESDEGNNRFPGGGAQSFDFASAPVLEVVVVPIHYARPGATASTPNTSDLTYLTWMPLKVLPVAQIVYAVRPAVHTFAGDLRTSSGWSQLLNEVTAIHAVEDLGEHKVYYGLVDSVAVDGCSGGCIAGIGWVNSPSGYASKTAVGFAGFPSNRNDASPTFTHEMGHNFGRRHSPCGVSGSVGPYPYGGGAPIGQWGYDAASGQLYSPSVYRDYMSYCSPEWTSDFTYHAVYGAWSWVSDPFGLAAAEPVEALVFSGHIDGAGRVHVGPAFVQQVPSARLASQGAYTLELVDTAGRVLARQSFDMVPFAVDEQGRAGHAGSGGELPGFQVALPVTAGVDGLQIYAGAELVYARQAGGQLPDLSAKVQITDADPGGGETWSLGAGSPGVIYRARFSPDGGETWYLLAAEANVPAAYVPGGLLAGAERPLLEVQASDGVQVTRSVIAP